MGCTTGIHNKELALFLNVKKKFNLKIIITEEKNHLSLSQEFIIEKMPSSQKRAEYNAIIISIKRYAILRL